MTNQVINKILKSKELNDSKYSLGFRRWDALPLRVRRSISLFYAIKYKCIGDNKAMIEFFQSMTSDQYIEFLKNN